MINKLAPKQYLWIGLVLLMSIPSSDDFPLNDEEVSSNSYMFI